MYVVNEENRNFTRKVKNDKPRDSTYSCKYNEDNDKESFDEHYYYEGYGYTEDWAYPPNPLRFYQ